VVSKIKGNLLNSNFSRRIPIHFLLLSPFGEANVILSGITIRFGCCFCCIGGGDPFQDDGGEPFLLTGLLEGGLLKGDRRLAPGTSAIVSELVTSLPSRSDPDNEAFLAVMVIFFSVA